MTIDTAPETITDAIDALRATGQPSTADLLEALAGERDRARQMFMHACEPLAASADIQDIVTAVEEWVNRRGGEETADQIAIMAVQAYQRAVQQAALTQGTPQ